MTPKVILAASSRAGILAWKFSIVPLHSGVIFWQPQGTGRFGDDRHIQSRERAVSKVYRERACGGGRCGHRSGPPLALTQHPGRRPKPKLSVYNFPLSSQG